MNIIKTNKACAACKYQRRKCTSECVLAPYFPADKPKMFGDAHRLFGVSNIQKILNDIKEGDERDDAMKSIIFESNIRAKFPIHGCLGVIKHYEGLLKEAFEELNQTNKLLAYCKLNDIPVLDNYGDAPNYYDNSENNDMMVASSSYFCNTIPHDVSNTLIGTNSKINSTDTTRVAQLSGVSNSGDDDIIEDNDNLMGTKGLFDNEEFDGDKLGIWDMDDVFINLDELLGKNKFDEFSSMECMHDLDMERSTPFEVGKSIDL